MTRLVRRRFWVEAASALTTAVLTLVTLISREWIELLLHVDPDGGSGLVEWGAVLACLTLTLILVGSARHEWRRVSAATA